MRASLGARSSLSAAAALWACATRCLYSSSFRLVRSPRFLLRCMGTPILPGQIPCMSGSPHGVLGAVQLLPWFLDGDGGAWAAAMETSAIAAIGNAKNRWFIGDLTSS